MARKSWTFKQARAAQERYRLKGGTVRGPFFQWVALHELDELEQRFVDGDRGALMLAIRKCANHDLVMPDWLARGYIRAFDAVNNYRSKSWDDVFGSPLPKGADLSARRKRREKSVAVWNEMDRRRKNGEAINDELFAAVGKSLGLGVTLTKDYYGEWKKRLGKKK